MRAARPSCATTIPGEADAAAMRAPLAGAASVSTGVCAASGPSSVRHAARASNVARAMAIIEFPEIGDVLWVGALEAPLRTWRHARAWRGHPRLVWSCAIKDVDGRDKPGHDAAAVRHER